MKYTVSVDDPRVVALARHLYAEFIAETASQPEPSWSLWDNDPRIRNRWTRKARTYVTVIEGAQK